MRAGRTKAGLLTRLERLESRVAVVGQHRFRVRFGKLKRLPQDYQGERHVVISKHLASKGDQEWVEFDELPGPDPSRTLELIGPQYMDIVFVEAYPIDPNSDRAYEDRHSPNPPA